MLYADPPFELGETLSGRDADLNLINLPWLGQAFFHPANRRGGPRASKARHTGKGIWAVALRNTSAGALLPKRLATLAYASAGVVAIETADGYADLTAEQRCVIVDPFLPAAGVAANDIFWGVINGRTTVTTTLGGGAATNIAVGAPLIAATAATSGATTAGRVQNITLPGQTGATDAFSMAKNLIGHALSARTTNETGADLLIDACIRY